MKIYRAVKTNKITQAFGENIPCAKVGVRPFVVREFKDNICPIGWEKFYTAIGMKGHNGHDFATWHGEPVFFPVDIPGIIWTAETHIDNDGGIGLDVYSDKPVEIDGVKQYLKFRFWHLKDIIVADGARINFGQMIGHADSTGASTGDHLHFSMKYVDENRNTLYRYNGYTGAQDITQYFENTFALDILNIKHSLISSIDLLHKIIHQLRSIIKSKGTGTAMENKKWFMSSSNNGDLSLTLKGIMLSVVPLLTIVLTSGTTIVVDDLQSILIEIVERLTSIVASAMIVVGLIRKVYNLIKNK